MVPEHPTMATVVAVDRLEAHALELEQLGVRTPAPRSRADGAVALSPSCNGRRSCASNSAAPRRTPTPSASRRPLRGIDRRFVRAHASDGAHESCTRFAAPYRRWCRAASTTSSPQSRSSTPAPSRLQAERPQRVRSNSPPPPASCTRTPQRAFASMNSACTSGSTPRLVLTERRDREGAGEQLLTAGPRADACCSTLRRAAAGWGGADVRRAACRRQVHTSRQGVRPSALVVRIVSLDFASPPLRRRLGAASCEAGAWWRRHRGGRAAPSSS